MDHLITTLKLNVEWNDQVLKPAEYVEKWRVILWNRAYGFFLSGNASPKFHKGTDLMKIEGGSMTSTRLLYRYVHFFDYLTRFEVFC